MPITRIRILPIESSQIELNDPSKNWPRHFEYRQIRNDMFFLFFLFFFLLRLDVDRTRFDRGCQNPVFSPQADSLFAYRSNLVPLFSAYRKMYMGDQVLGYTCTMCSKFYKMWSNYLKHKCEPPQFKCPLCPFAAFKAFILHAHQAEQHFKVTSPNT